ncbi:MAG: serine/threonine protein kinase, partial [Candidatus Riflebacteria bacterium]|nr:serine/threonine protein kinase [Candidatus Riflebacteria bacterium]
MVDTVGPLSPGLRTLFSIGAELGRGGMGVVYRAVQKSLSREVALKVLNPDVAADHVFRERFVREARTAAAVVHPHLVRLLDFDLLDDGTAYIAYEFVDGLNLHVRLGQGPVPAEEARRIAAHVAAGLAALHRQGVLHRDVKPPNVLLARGGNAKLADLGIARPLAERAALTADGVILGTLEYLAPEQIMSVGLSTATDVYAFGALIYTV